MLLITTTRQGAITSGWYVALRGLLATTLLAITGCFDDGSDNPLPSNAEVTVSPAEKSFDIDENLDADGNCVIDENFYIDQTIVITVTSNGSPIGKADLNISVDYGANTFGGFPVMALYDDLNSNGVVDGPVERVTDANDPVFRTKTKEFTGERVVILRLNLSCGYRGSLNVRSDGFTGVGDYEVNAGGSPVGGG